MKEKKITIESLAGMVQRGFLEMDKKFSGMDRRFDRMDNEFSAIRKQLGNVVYRFEFEKLEDRVKDLESLLAIGNKKH